MSMPQSIQDQLGRLADTFRAERREVVSLTMDNSFATKKNLQKLAMEKERQFERLYTTLSDISNGKQAV